MHTRRDVAVAALVVVGVGAWCGWVSGFHRSTTAAEWTWVASAAAVVVVDVLLRRGRLHRSPGWRLQPATEPWPAPGRRPRSTLVGVAPWLGLLVVVAAWEALGIATGVHQPHLTISALAQAFRPLDAALLLTWMALGVGYGAARARSPLATTSGAAPDADRPGTSPAAIATAHPAVGVPALLLPASRAAGVAFWVAVVAGAVVIDIVARRSLGRLAGAEQFVRWLTGPPVMNLVVVAAWTFAGYHLFAR